MERQQAKLDDGRLLFPLVQKALRELADQPDHNPEELGGYRRQAQGLMGRIAGPNPLNHAEFTRTCKALEDLWLQVIDASS